MKTLVATIVLLCSFFPTAFANEKVDSTPKWTLQVDPLTTILGFAHLQVEYAFTNHQSLYLTPSIRLLNSPLTDEDYDAWGVEAGYRYFWYGHAPTGLWVEARILMSHLSTEKKSAIGGYAGILAGHTWRLKSRFILSLGVGIQYLHLKVGDQGKSKISPALHTTFGTTF